MSATPRSDSPSQAASTSKIRRVAILFAGGPAPAANAVISTAAASFLRTASRSSASSTAIPTSSSTATTTRCRRVAITSCSIRTSSGARGTRRGHPDRHRPHQPRQGRHQPGHLADPEPHRALADGPRGPASLGVDALISIGGDDTLKTANKFKRFQEHLPEDEPRIAVVHVPKTIDNDYRASTSLSATSRPSRRWPAKSATSWPTPRPSRCTSWPRPWAERRLAGLRRRHRRRGEPGHQRRGHRRRAPRPRRRSPTPRPGQPSTRRIMDLDKLVGGSSRRCSPASRRARSSA